MKRKTLVFLLALAIILTLAPAAASAAEPTAEDLKTPPDISRLEIHDDGEGCIWLEVTVRTPGNVRSAVAYYENHELGYNQAGYIGGIVLEFSIDGGEWQESMLGHSPNYDQDPEDPWNGIFETYYVDELHVNSVVKAHARYTGADADGELRYSDWSNMLTLNEPVNFNASSWARDTLAEADAQGLIPDCLRDANLREPITRAEFAAVSVKLFEALTTLKAEPAAVNPFTDTDDPEVLKAYNVGITNGTSATTFKPDALISRQEAASMLTRVWKKVNLSGWTLDTDGQFKEAFRACFTMPEPFADDGEISGWAKDSVYFMAAKGIVQGVGNNIFAPKTVESGEKTLYYATRQEALVMSVRTVNNP